MSGINMISAIDYASGYLLDPLNQKHENKELALLITIVAGILTLGVAQGLSALWRLCRPVEENETHKKIYHIFREIFCNNKTEDNSEQIHSSNLSIDSSKNIHRNISNPSLLPSLLNATPLPINPSGASILNSVDQIHLKAEDNVLSLVDKLNAVAEAPSWEEAKISFGEVNYFIEKNLRLINSQTENHDTASQLKKALLALSNRITKEAEVLPFDSRTDYNKLAFDVQGYALGIYSETDKPNWTNSSSGMLPELREKIFSFLTPQDSEGVVNSNLIDLSSVSKAWSESALMAKKTWINENNISLKTFGYKKASEAVKMIINHKLTSANLNRFRDFTGDDLIKLSDECSDLEHLFIPFSSVLTGNHLIQALPKFTKLKTLKISYCEKIKGGEMSDALSSLSELTVLKLNGRNIVENGLEVLPNLKKLTDLDLSVHPEVTYTKRDRRYDIGISLYSSRLVNLEVSKLSNLEVLNLSDCPDISEKKLAEELSQLGNLRVLKLNRCVQIQGVEEFVTAISQLKNLKYLDLSVTSIDEESLVEILLSLPYLTTLKLRDCTKIQGYKLAEALPSLTNLKTLNLTGCRLNGEGNLDEAISKLTNLTVERFE